MTHSDDSDKNGFDGNPPTNLLPYQEWIETAYRHVARNALKYAQQNGIPGNHSFYLTFDTSYPGVSIPSRLKAQFPNEMTIVLQHQFWDLIVDEQEKKLSVGLSFGGVASTLIIPFGAFTAFSDPEAKLLLNYTKIPPFISPVSDFLTTEKVDPEHPAKPSEHIEEKPKNKEDSQVISLDAFRKKHD